VGKTLLIVILIVIPVVNGIAQDPNLDKLEMWYDQGHYRLVLRKSNQLIKLDEYADHGLPHMWKALSIAGLGLKKSRNYSKPLEGSAHSYRDFLQKENASYYQETYYNEITNYQELFLNHIAELKKSRPKKAHQLFDVYRETFDGYMAYDEIVKSEIPEISKNISKGPNSRVRKHVVEEAKQYLGTPYKWGGSNKKGFDCSGYTSYVMAKNGINIPRMAQDQSTKAAKINIQSAQPGDLVFFGSGATVTHVGIVISAPGEELSMIHASSSKGIMISNIENSPYWKQRLLFTGSVIE